MAMIQDPCFCVFIADRTWPSRWWRVCLLKSFPQQSMTTNTCLTSTVEVVFVPRLIRESNEWLMFTAYLTLLSVRLPRLIPTLRLLR